MLDTDLFNQDTPLAEYRSDVWRVVESQEHVATLELVDDLAEQALLEQLLDNAKPKYRAGTESMHYLLKTAFRYPPLRWGSRFGTNLMPSYFYASEQAATALCECAYYRFLFLDDMQQSYERSIRSEHSVFKVLLRSDACLDLTADEFSSQQAQLRAPDSYDTSQSVGKWAFERGDVAMIRFVTARASTGNNIAVAEPSVIRSKKPSVQQRWLCMTKSASVSFSSRESELSYMFPRSDFCDENGKLLRVR